MAALGDKVVEEWTPEMPKVRKRKRRKRRMRGGRHEAGAMLSPRGEGAPLRGRRE